MFLCRIGVTTDPAQIERSKQYKKPEILLTMCRDDAPAEWHSSVLRTFRAESWMAACQYFDVWLKTNVDSWLRDQFKVDDDS